MAAHPHLVAPVQALLVRAALVEERRPGRRRSRRRGSANAAASARSAPGSHSALASENASSSPARRAHRRVLGADLAAARQLEHDVRAGRAGALRGRVGAGSAPPSTATISSSALARPVERERVGDLGRDHRLPRGGPPRSASTQRRLGQAGGGRGGPPAAARARAAPGTARTAACVQAIRTAEIQSRARATAAHADTRRDSNPAAGPMLPSPRRPCARAQHWGACRPSSRPILRDGDLTLRPPRPDDADAVTAACQDPEIPRWTLVPSPYRREHAVRVAGRLARCSARAGEAASYLGFDAGRPPRRLHQPDGARPRARLRRDRVLDRRRGTRGAASRPGRSG